MERSGAVRHADWPERENRVVLCAGEVAFRSAPPRGVTRRDAARRCVVGVTGAKRRGA